MEVGLSVRTEPISTVALHLLARARSAYFILSLCAFIGSIVLSLFGVVVTAPGMLSSDVASFFLLTGAHLIACGVIAVTCVWVDRRRGHHFLLCRMSMLVNAAFVLRITILILNGTVRGPLIVVALLLSLPAALNVGAAALKRRRRERHIE